MFLLGWLLTDITIGYWADLLDIVDGTQPGAVRPIDKQSSSSWRKGIQAVLLYFQP